VVVQGAGHVGIESVEPVKNFLDPARCGRHVAILAG
jgi:hypothetical protein